MGSLCAPTRTVWRVVEWFEEEYSYRDFSARDFIALIVEKLEG